MGEPTESAVDDLIARLEALSPDALRAEIERANQYLASDEGIREFGTLLSNPASRSSDAKKDWKT